MDTKPELLAPAGSPEALDAAIAAGADAVYFSKVSRTVSNCENLTGKGVIL